jgi:2-polyprenyl-6-hydroxyphenyl methylase/3-demethylubiquinone-9 3-methyltransferase
MAADAANLVKQTLKLQPMVAIRPWFNYKSNRGMSRRRDLIDWVGGFPFEFAKYDVLEAYLAARGFFLTKGKRASSLGCHELVFERG